MQEKQQHSQTSDQLSKPTQETNQPAVTSIADELSKLAKLKEQGVITEEEFLQMINNHLEMGIRSGIPQKFIPVLFLLLSILTCSLQDISEPICLSITSHCAVNRNVVECDSELVLLIENSRKKSELRKN